MQIVRIAIPDGSSQTNRAQATDSHSQLTSDSVFLRSYLSAYIASHEKSEDRRLQGLQYIHLETEQLVVY